MRRDAERIPAHFYQNKTLILFIPFIPKKEVFMFRSKNAQQSLEEMELAEKCRIEAGELYRSGRYHCAEAVLAVVRNHFRPDLPEEVVQMASGFGGGSGSGCMCGAVSGATVGLGLVLREDKKRISHLTRELHDWFKGKYGVTCCKTIRAGNDKGICLVLTGEVAGKTAEMLSRYVESEHFSAISA
jgi:C_GCAxxG_C_C family probable redox protein